MAFHSPMASPPPPMHFASTPSAPFSVSRNDTKSPMHLLVDTAVTYTQSPRMNILTAVLSDDSEAAQKKKKRQPPNPEKKSQYRGVSWQKTSKAWVAQFKLKGHTTYLGLFNTELEAAKAYDIAVFLKGSRNLNFDPPTTDELDEFRKNGNMPVGRLGTSSAKLDPSASRASRLSKDRGATSHYRGVSWYAARKIWKASIQVNRKKEYIGRFETEEEAARAYNLRALELRGSEAILNQVPDTYTRYPPSEEGGAAHDSSFADQSDDDGEGDELDSDDGGAQDAITATGANSSYASSSSMTATAAAGASSAAAAAAAVTAAVPQVFAPPILKPAPKRRSAAGASQEGGPKSKKAKTTTFDLPPIAPMPRRAAVASSSSSSSSSAMARKDHQQPLTSIVATPPHKASKENLHHLTDLQSTGGPFGADIINQDDDEDDELVKVIQTSEDAFDTRFMDVFRSPMLNTSSKKRKADFVHSGLPSTNTNGLAFTPMMSAVMGNFCNSPLVFHSPQSLNFNLSAQVQKSSRKSIIT